MAMLMYKCPILDCYKEIKGLAKIRAHVIFEHRKVGEAPDDAWRTSDREKFTWRSATTEEIDEADTVVNHKRKPKSVRALSTEETSTEEAAVTRKATRPVKVFTTKRKPKAPSTATSAASSAPPAEKQQAIDPDVFVPTPTDKTREGPDLRLTMEKFQLVQKKLTDASVQPESGLAAARCTLGDPGSDPNAPEDEGTAEVTSLPNVVNPARGDTPVEIPDDDDSDSEGNLIVPTAVPQLTANGRVVYVSKGPGRRVDPPSSFPPSSFNYGDLCIIASRMETHCRRPFVTSEILKIMQPLFPGQNTNELVRLIQMSILMLKTSLLLSHNELARIRGELDDEKKDALIIQYSSRIAQDIYHSDAPLVSDSSGWEKRRREAGGSGEGSSAMSG